MMASSAAGTYVHPSSSSTRDELLQLPCLPGSDSLPSSQISLPRARSVASYPSTFSTSASFLENHARTTPVHAPLPRSTNYLDEALARPLAYDQNYPPGETSSLLSLAKTRPTMSKIQQDGIQNGDHDMAPAIFGAPSARISSKLPTASHQVQDRPCFVSDLPTATTTSQPGISQPSTLQTAPTTGVKRRLGMGRTTGGYSNKKFKPPT
jgi:hypothetical protein